MSISGALIKKASAQTAANYLTGSGTQTDGVIISWDTVSYDTLSFFNAGSGTKLTVASVLNGYYAVLTCNLSLAGIPAGNNVLVSILKNGSTQYIGFGGTTRFSGNTTAGSPATAWVSFRTSPIILASGDYFEVRLYSGDNSIDVNSESTFGIRILTSNTQTQRCLVKKSADQAAANYSAGLTAVAWDSEVYDTDTIHDTVTTNSRLTVPSALNGKYGIAEASILGNNFTANSQIAVGISRNGSQTYTGFGGNSVECGISTAGLVATTQPILLSTGDYFEALLWTDDTSITLLSAYSNFGIRVVA